MQIFVSFPLTKSHYVDMYTSEWHYNVLVDKRDGNINPHKGLR